MCKKCSKCDDSNKLFLFTIANSENGSCKVKLSKKCGVSNLGTYGNPFLGKDSQNKCWFGGYQTICRECIEEFPTVVDKWYHINFTACQRKYFEGGGRKFDIMVIVDVDKGKAIYKREEDLTESERNMVKKGDYDYDSD